MLAILLLSLSLIPSIARADMTDAWERARTRCLSPGNGQAYKPTFGPLADANHIDSFRTWARDGVTTVELPDASSPEEHELYRDMRASLRRYAAAESLDELQKLCAVQCVAAYFFDNTRVGEPSTRFRDASGMCSESTELAESLSASLGLDIESVQNGLISRLLGRDAFHEFSLVTADGRRFVMNNNWRADVCHFRFAYDWETHRGRASFGSGRVATRYLTEWDRQRAVVREARERARAAAAQDHGPRY